MNNKFLKTLLLFGAVALTTMTAFAASVITTTVNRQSNLSGSGNGDPVHVEKEESKHRLPDRPIPCTIDIDYGIQFTGQETPDFILYEIYDSNNTCIGAYGDEADFINALLPMSGEFRITLTSTDAVYTGYVMP